MQYKIDSLDNRRLKWVEPEHFSRNHYREACGLHLVQSQKRSRSCCWRMPYRRERVTASGTHPLQLLRLILVQLAVPAARLTRCLTRIRSAVARNFSRLAAKNRPSRRLPLSLVIRSCQTEPLLCKRTCECKKTKGHAMQDRFTQRPLTQMG